MTRRVATALVLAALGVALTACAAQQDGKILEVERGRNGVKVEVQVGADPDDTEEVYLIRSTECDEGEFLPSCADADDYLVQQPSAVPGLNRTHNRGGDR